MIAREPDARAELDHRPSEPEDWRAIGVGPGDPKK